MQNTTNHTEIAYVCAYEICLYLQINVLWPTQNALWLHYIIINIMFCCTVASAGWLLLSAVTCTS